MNISEGSPFPLGATRTHDGWNIAIYSKKKPQFCYAPYGHPGEHTFIPLSEKKHKTGDIWHLFLEHHPLSFYYGFKVGKNVLIDPYAHYVDFSLKTPLAIASDPLPFDWEHDSPPKIASKDLIIYEMHVRGFTQDSSSKVQHKGTFSGLIEKISHLKELGITACQLMPILAFENNYWGYSPLSFFSLMQQYGSNQDPLQVGKEFKQLVKELHKNGIEVILDLVYNHTGEGGKGGETLSWKGFDEKSYYLLNKHNEYYNYSGCGNTVNTNHPIVQDQIIASLTYLVTEYHVDGFRFDLASVFSRSRDEGKLLPLSPIVERISADPILKDVKLIAEPWDAAGLYQLGSFISTSIHGEKRWKEWNDSFRDSVRAFLKGNRNTTGPFATKLCGSEDVYGHKGSPYNSINFVTCHDGFSLRDLVSYNEKHNEANGEENRDGTSNNLSSNYGVEGESDDPAIIAIRERQMKNFLMALFFSFGIPMVRMGDEYGHTQDGNNNPWCQDNRISWFLWDELEKNQELFTFLQKLIAFRRERSFWKKNHFLSPHDIIWHGREPRKPNWSEDERLIAYELCGKKGENLFVAFNSGKDEESLHLPPPPKGKKWSPLLSSYETSKPLTPKKTVTLPPYSAISFIAA